MATKNVELEETAGENPIEVLAGMEAFQYVVPPASLSPSNGLRIMATLAKIMGDDGETDTQNFDAMLIVAADLFDVIVERCTKSKKSADALEAHFTGKMSDAMEFALAYAGAVGELFGSDN